MTITIQSTDIGKHIISIHAEKSVIGYYVDDADSSLYPVNSGLADLIDRKYYATLKQAKARYNKLVRKYS